MTRKKDKDQPRIEGNQYITTSYGQEGGITVGHIEVKGPQPALEWLVPFGNDLREDVGGYLTRVMVGVADAYAARGIQFEVRGKHLLNFDAMPLPENVSPSGAAPVKMYGRQRSRRFPTYASWLVDLPLAKAYVVEALTDEPDELEFTLTLLT